MQAMKNNMNTYKNRALYMLKGAATIILAVVLFAPAAYAQAPRLEVVFGDTPLFNESNFLPGNAVERTVEVTNNTEEDQSVIAEAINAADSEGLGEVLELTISEGASVLYSGTLGAFLRGGEVPLSVLPGTEGENQTTYTFSISFQEGAGNESQTTALGFDLCIGFEGAEGDLNCGDTVIGGEGDTDGGGTSGEGGTVTGSAGGGGGGPVNITPLGVSGEEATDTDTSDGTATIEWSTNLLATSQVIYGPAYDGLGGPEVFYSLNLTDMPYFGYPMGTTESSVKTTEHSVLLAGLLPGQTYKYRVVSRASPPTVGYEHTFALVEEKVEEGAPTGGTEGVGAGSASEEESGLGGTFEGLAVPGSGSGGSAGVDEVPAEETVSEENAAAEDTKKIASAVKARNESGLLSPNTAVASVAFSVDRFELFVYAVSLFFFLIVFAGWYLLRMFRRRG